MRVGVDFGGTKIEAVAIDQTGAVRARRRTPTPRGDYAGSVRAVRDLVAAVEAEAGEAAPRIGIGIPGTVSPDTGCVRNGNTVWLIGHPFEADLSAAFGRPAMVTNDANCFAMSEAADGAGAGKGVVFCAILGTGVGGGLVVDGRVVTGRNGIAGEWGHTPLPNPRDDEKPAPICSCGRPNCLEAWLAGPAIAADFARLVGCAPADAPTAPEIAQMAADGDDQADAVLRRHSERLGRALAVIVNTIDPDVIVMGGGVSNIDRIYRDAFEAMRPHVFSDTCLTEIVRARHGDSSGVRGAAFLWDGRP